MIRHFQEMYFKNRYVQTIAGAGYATPDFEGIAKAYGIQYLCYEHPQDVSEAFMRLEGPMLVEVCLKQNTYVFPSWSLENPIRTRNHCSNVICTTCLWSYKRNVV